MTLSNTQTQITVEGNDLTSTWDYDFPLGGQSSYAVLVYTDADGAESTIPSADFTITGVDNEAGGTFTYPLVGDPIEAGTTLTLSRVVPLVQNAAIVDQGNFYPTTVEGALDYAMMAIQQLQTQITALEAEIEALS